LSESEQARADPGDQGIHIVELEQLAGRDGRRFRTELRRSKLPHHKTLDDYGFSYWPDLDPAKSATWPPSRSSRPKPTSPYSGRPASAGPTSR
jgi:IstB-like ATP binding protein